MRVHRNLGFSLATINLFAQAPHNYWEEFKAKRDALPSVHQEFEVTRVETFVGGTRHTRRQVTVDFAKKQWRESAGIYTEVFDGSSIFRMDVGNEFTLTKRNPRNELPMPDAYTFGEAEWARALEADRKACPFEGSNHTCITLDVRLTPWTLMAEIWRQTSGSSRVVFDLDTGLLVSSWTLQALSDGPGKYTVETTYKLKTMNFSSPAEPALFAGPSGKKEVWQLPRWDAARVTKEIRGKSAKELSFTRLDGHLSALSAFQGQPLLLVLWASWCRQCRADMSTLSELIKRNDGKLAVLGIAVDDDPAELKTFLEKNQVPFPVAQLDGDQLPELLRRHVILDGPHRYPAALNTESELPAMVRFATLPVFAVIGPDGKYLEVVSSISGVQKSLKSLGLQQ